MEDPGESVMNFSISIVALSQSLLLVWCGAGCSKSPEEQAMESAEWRVRLEAVAKTGLRQ